MESEVPLYFRPGPEKHVHRFPGCRILRYDNAVNSVAFQEDRRIVHPRCFSCQTQATFELFLRRVSGKPLTWVGKCAVIHRGTLKIAYIETRVVESRGRWIVQHLGESCSGERPVIR